MTTSPSAPINSVQINQRGYLFEELPNAIAHLVASYLDMDTFLRWKEYMTNAASTAFSETGLKQCKELNNYTRTAALKKCLAANPQLLPGCTFDFPLSHVALDSLAPPKLKIAFVTKKVIGVTEKKNCFSCLHVYSDNDYVFLGSNYHYLGHNKKYAFAWGEHIHAICLASGVVSEMALKAMSTPQTSRNQLIEKVYALIKSGIVSSFVENRTIFLVGQTGIVGKFYFNMKKKKLVCSSITDLQSKPTYALRLKNVIYLETSSTDHTQVLAAFISCEKRNFSIHPLTKRTLWKSKATCSMNNHVFSIKGHHDGCLRLKIYCEFNRNLHQKKQLKFPPDFTQESVCLVANDNLLAFSASVKNKEEWRLLIYKMSQIQKKWVLNVLFDQTFNGTSPKEIILKDGRLAAIFDKCIRFFDLMAPLTPYAVGSLPIANGTFPSINFVSDNQLLMLAVPPDQLFTYQLTRYTA